MNETRVNTFFVSEKISKVRWVAEPLKESERFITGSWDMPTNFVRIWRLQSNQYADEYNEYVPRCSDKITFKGDISGLEFVADNAVAVCGSDGHLSIIKINRAVEVDTLESQARSSLLHKFNAGEAAAPCTALSVYGKEIATVGEDGRLNIVDVGAAKLSVRRTIMADSCTINTVAYVNPQEVLTGNRMGVIRLFDVRASSDTADPIAFKTSCQDEKCSNYVSCLASHPTQAHIVLAGSEEGSITVWDLRKPGFPASYLSAHQSAITELGFHRADPSRLFTSSECGELWLWSQHSTIDSIEKSSTDNINPWLSGERTKNRISVTSLISELRKPINTFDSIGSKIICGSDTEAIYFVDNMF